jgi:protein-disulfide isomerase
MIRPMLKKCLLVAAGLGITVVGGIACQKGDPALTDKMDKLQATMDRIAKRVDQIGTGAAAPSRPQPPARPGPDPSAVYSVAIGEAPVRGPANAKVTIVEAADFA